MAEVAAIDWVRRGPSAAIGQRSMGDPTRLFPLFPPLLEGCPASSTPAMQYPLEIDYDYGKVPAQVLRQPPLAGLERWAPLLPPVKPGLSLGEGGTPLIVAERVGGWIGMDGLWLKDESQNPTWSHKDRLNYCVISAALAAGAPGIAVASSGNHGAAAAAYAARAGLPCVVVTSPAAQPAFRQLVVALGADVVIVPTEERWTLLRRIVAETGFMPASNLTRFPTGNPFGPEGYKSIAYEIFAQLGGMPGTVVAPTGYGELLYGVAKGFRELLRFGCGTRMPRMCSAEPAARGPLAQALRRNQAAVEVSAAPSRAAGIAVTVNGYRGVVAVRDSGGSPLLFSEAAMVEATEQVGREGLWQEFSGAAGLAALREAVQQGEHFEPPVVAILTSTGLKELPALTDGVPAHEGAAIETLIRRLAAGKKGAVGA